MTGQSNPFHVFTIQQSHHNKMRVRSTIVVFVRNFAINLYPVGARSENNKSFCNSTLEFKIFLHVVLAMNLKLFTQISENYEYKILLD